jgi:hypothetical protein
MNEMGKNISRTKLRIWLHKLPKREQYFQPFENIIRLHFAMEQISIFCALHNNQTLGRAKKNTPEQSIYTTPGGKRTEK